MAGQGIISPVLPLFAKEFGVGTTAIGFVVGVFGLSRLFLNLPSGMIGERFGRRLLMGGGLVLGAAGLFLTGTASSIVFMALWRFVSGAGSAMYMTGAMSFIADISTPGNRGRLMSLQQGSLLLGTDLGPIIGGFVADTLGFRWPFYMAGMLSGTAALWVMLRLPEPRRAPDVTETATTPGPGIRQGWDMRAVGKLLTNPTFVLLSLFTMMVFFTRTGSRQTILPILAVDRIGMSATHLGFLFTFMTTINLLLVLPAGALTDRFGRKAVIMPGALVTIAGLTLFALASNMWLFFAGGALLGVGTGMIGPAPAAYAGDLSPQGKTGVTMGLYRTFGDVGFIVGPILLGFIADTFRGRFTGIMGEGVAMEVNAALILLTAVLLVFLGKETAGRRMSRGKGPA
jgi:MFS family permease